MVWSTRLVLPALPFFSATSKWYVPPLVLPGRNSSSVDESSAPWTSAPEMDAAAMTAVRCCGWRPAFFLVLRMFVIFIGVPSTQDRASDVRRIWPPPSPKDPSMHTMSGPDGRFIS